MLPDKRMKKETHLRTNGRFSVEKRTVSSFPLHAHEYFEIEIIESGSGRLFLNGNEYEISRGSAYLLSPSDFHEIITDGTLTLWNISFDESKTSLKSDIFLNAPLYGKFCDSALEKIIKASELLIIEQRTDNRIDPLLEYVLMQFDAFCDRAYDSASYINKTIMYIKNHFREDPPLSAVAEKIGLSPVYLGSVFKKSTGRSYTEYLTLCKLSCAAMLLQSGMDVTNACFSSGFGSLSGFLYAFKKYKFTTPAEYKNIYKQKSPCRH